MSSSTGTSKQKKGLRQYLGLKDSFGKSRSRSPSQSRSQPDIETPSVTTGPNEGAGSSTKTSSGIPSGGDYETISHLTTPPSVGSSEPTGTTSSTPIIVEPPEAGQRAMRPSLGLEAPLKSNTPDTGTPTNLAPASSLPSDPTNAISITPAGGENANVEASLGLLSPEIESGPSGRSTSGPITSASISPVQGQKIRSVAWDGLREALGSQENEHKTIDGEKKGGEHMVDGNESCGDRCLRDGSPKTRAAKKIESLVTSGENSENEPVPSLDDQSTRLHQ